MAAETSDTAWVEIIEPQSHERMFANPTTGEIVLTPPEGVTIKPMSQNQWWELYDQVTDRNYYYNAHTGETIWNKPVDADIIPLTKLQSVPPEDDQPREIQREEVDFGTSTTPIIDQNSHRMSMESNSAASRKSSDAFSRELGTLSPLEFEVRGERFSSLDPVITAQQQQQLLLNYHHQHPSSIQEQHEQYTEEYRHHASPNRERTTNRGASSQSSGSPDEIFATEQKTEWEEDRRAGSAEPLTNLDGQVQNMSYEQKSRTLDILPSKQRKKERARERLGSNPNPTPYARAYSPTHPAPKAPAVKEKGKLKVESGSLHHKTRSVDISVTEIDGEKTHTRAKSDIPPAPPLLKLTPRGAASLKGAVKPLEHFKELAQHRRGLFRKKVTIANMLAWTKDPIKRPMIITRDKQLKKEAVELFKLVLQFMSDRKTRYKDANAIALEITTRCWETKGLRDEIYVQLCRQTTANDKPKSLERGWQLFSICLAFFPPTFKFRSYLEGYLWRHVDPLPENKGVPVEVYAQYCHKRVEKMTQSGAKKGVKKPSIEELMHAREAPFHPSMFGASLEDVMELQADKFPDYRVPWVCTILCDAIVRLSGPQTEGIFRVPGDIDEVNSLKLHVEKGNLPEPSLVDPHIPASLLKLWFRELEDPLIPEEYYQDCVDNCEHKENALSLVKSLPNLNKRVLIYLVAFLKKFITPENIEATKMGVENLAMVWAPNFLRCPSEDHALIFQNTRKEMAFLRLLIKYLITDAISSGEATATSPSP